MVAMTTKMKIDLIIERRYKGYRGTLMKHLRESHNELRKAIGEDEFLKFLNKLEQENPRPKYKLPINNLDEYEVVFCSCAQETILYADECGFVYCLNCDKSVPNNFHKHDLV